VSERTSIEWATHTFNPWSGCHKVSPACTNCYAANAMPSARRFAEWGPNEARVPASESYWRQPLSWDRKAAAAGERHRVFCASMADVFEDRRDLDEWRWRLLALIALTPNLDWLLLTKRPDHMAAVLNDPATYQKVLNAATAWRTTTRGGTARFNELIHIGISDPARGWRNLWAGTTVEDQEHADERIPELLKVPARVRFLSMEPLLGPVDLRSHLHATACPMHPSDGTKYASFGCPGCNRIHWVIAGGESGRRARPSHPDWFRSLRDQCAAAGVPFFFKQHGEWLPFYDRDRDDPDWADIPDEVDGVQRINLAGGRGFHGDRVVYLRKVGKAAAGRLLDGVEHNAFPVTP
jgi:protein gp37